jgi:hypothetical protein
VGNVRIMVMDKIIKRSVVAAHKLYGNPLGIGRNRVTFAHSPGWVIKVPINDWGLLDNESEAETFQCFGRTNAFIKYAQCRIEFDQEGIPLLLMERLAVDIPLAGLPEWCDFVDCQQVGIGHDGQLLAYDYSHIR